MGDEYSCGMETTYDDLEDAGWEHSLRCFHLWQSPQMKLLTITTAEKSSTDRAVSARAHMKLHVGASKRRWKEIARFEVNRDWRATRSADNVGIDEAREWASGNGYG